MTGDMDIEAGDTGVGSGHDDQAGQAGRAGQVAQADQTGRTDQAGQIGQATQVAQSGPGPLAPLSVSATLGRLQFHKSDKFRILQLSDIQDGSSVSADTIRLIEAACDASRPDLVVFSGNQVAGYDSEFSQTATKRPWSSPWDLGLSETDRQAATDATRALVKKNIQTTTAPLVSRGIPFAVTYGNHDFQCGLDESVLDALYREVPGCCNPPSISVDPAQAQNLPSSGLKGQVAYACEPGTFCLPVHDEDEAVVFLIVLLHSGTYALEGGCGSLSVDAREFLKDQPQKLDAQGIIFQNIPLPQYYRLLKPVPPTRAHAVEGYRTFSKTYYEIDPEKTVPGSYLGEGISCPDKDTGEFAIARDQGYFAISAGHDHRNGFAGSLEGVMLMATPTCGFGSYGPAPAKRAARLLEFDLRHPYEPRTQLLEFGDLVGKASSKKSYSFGANYVPQAGEEEYDLVRPLSRWERFIRAAKAFFRRQNKQD